jgi:hypothetical protein
LRPGATINGSVPGSATLKVINTDEGTIYGDGVRATVYSDGSFGVYAEAYGEDCRGVFAHTTRTDSPAVYGYSEKDIGVYGKGKESGGYFTTMAAGTLTNLTPGVNISTQYTYNPGVRINTNGSSSDGVYVRTNGVYSLGVYANTSGGGSPGVFAYTTGTGSPAVQGISEKDVGMYGKGNEAGGYFTTTAAGTWNNWKPGVDVSTRYTYNPGVRINTTGNDSYGVDVSTDGDGSYGVSVATTDRDSRGVYAHTEGDLSYGVYALTEGKNSKGVYALTMDDESDGVYALTEGDESEGVYAYTTGDNSEGVYAWTKGDQSHGVYAHTETNKSYGVYAKTDGDYSHGVYAKTDGYESFGVNAYTSGPRSPAVLGESEKWYGGYFVSDDYFGLYARGVWYAATLSGDLMVWGDIDKDGSCRFVEDHPTDPTKEIVYVCLEGGETGTYTRGSAQLTDGTVVVQLPEHFSLVTSAEGLTVQVTPTSECRGLYVVSKSPTEFVVKELNGGTGDATFDFLVNGIRKGYEEFQPIRDKREMPEIGDSGWTPEHLGDEHQLSPEDGEDRD